MGKDYRLLQVHNAFGAPVYMAEETDSTMDDARELAAAIDADAAGTGSGHGTVLRAARQRRGRGRFRDRSWLNESGRDLMFTIILDSDKIATKALPLSCGLALLRAIDRWRAGRQPPPELKWPNDILAGGKKLSGILCEGDGRRFYAGIGLNCLVRPFPPEIEAKAGSLEGIYGTGVDMNALFSSILEALQGELGKPFDPEAAGARLYGLGRNVRFLEGMPERGDVLEGEIAGLGSGGELLIRTAGGLRACASGEILF